MWGSQFKNNYLTEMCSGSEAGSYLRFIDFVCHSTLGLSVIKKKKKTPNPPSETLHPNPYVLTLFEQSTGVFWVKPLNPKP